MDDLPWYIAIGERRVMGINDREADLEAGMQRALERIKAVPKAARKYHKRLSPLCNRRCQLDGVGVMSASAVETAPFVVSSSVRIHRPSIVFRSSIRNGFVR